MTETNEKISLSNQILLTPAMKMNSEYKTNKIYKVSKKSYRCYQKTKINFILTFNTAKILKCTTNF